MRLERPGCECPRRRQPHTNRSSAAEAGTFTQPGGVEHVATGFCTVLEFGTVFCHQLTMEL